MIQTCWGPPTLPDLLHFCSLNLKNSSSAAGVIDRKASLACAAFRLPFLSAF
jgi:hypothetical protein